MSLFWQEHKKLWRSGLTRLAVCGMMLLTLGLQVWTMQCVSFGTMRADGSHKIDGYTNIRKNRQYAGQWQTLTDETAQDMVRTYQQILAENPEFDGALSDFGFLQGTLVSFLWPEVEDQTQPYPTLTIHGKHGGSDHIYGAVQYGWARYCRRVTPAAGAAPDPGGRV